MSGVSSVTIYDVASLARVSVTTVSKIINHKDFEISPETRKRVLEAIKEINFVPSGLARSLVTKRTNVLGLLIPDISNQYFADIARGVEDGASALGYNVMLCNTDESHQKELKYLQILSEKGVDGIIIVPFAESEVLFTDEFKYDKPFVLLDRFYENLPCSVYQVRFDNARGGYLATKHLTERGHRRIGIITGPSKNSPSNDRLRGYRQALAQAGIQPDDSLVFEGNYKIESGIEGTDYLLRTGVTAIFALNDLMACGVYKALNDRGLRIPDDLSVMGYDNISISDILTPHLSTIMQPKHEMGQLAAVMLINQIREEEQEALVIFEPCLMERQSVQSLRISVTA